MKTSRGPEKPATSLTSRFASGNSSAISRYGRAITPQTPTKAIAPAIPPTSIRWGIDGRPLTSQAIAATTQAAASP